MSCKSVIKLKKKDYLQHDAYLRCRLNCFVPICSISVAIKCPRCVIWRHDLIKTKSEKKESLIPLTHIYKLLLIFLAWCILVGLVEAFKKEGKEKQQKTKIEKQDKQTTPPKKKSC